MAWFDLGDPTDPPVVVLHGGPGGRSRAASLAWFDGLGLRRLAFDQRGCGQSRPAGECAHNTLALLVDDIERLRTHLGLARWALAGGSWGALVALAYAAAHPNRVDGLFLRSSFLGSDAEVGHFFGPWADWLGENHRATIARGLPGVASLGVPDPLRLLQGVTAACTAGTGNALSRADAQAWSRAIATAWDGFEQAQSRPGGASSGPPTPATALAWPPPAVAAAAPLTGGAAAETVAQALPTGLRVQVHFLQRHCFVDDAWRAQMLGRLDAALADRPVALVHGLEDAVCSPRVSEMLARRWPGALVRWVPGAGHDMDHPALSAALRETARAWAMRLPGCKALA